jgi:PIN domain nuclease of toxin-antitoxin system
VILLDTHAWLWWLGEPKRLGAGAAAALARAVEDDAVHISTISAWEVALLIERGRLELDRSAEELVRATEALPFVEFVDVDARIAARSVRLELPHPDPADRLIAATAELLGCPLVTADRRLRDAPWLTTIW